MFRCEACCCWRMLARSDSAATAQGCSSCCCWRIAATLLLDCLAAASSAAVAVVVVRLILVAGLVGHRLLLSTATLLRLLLLLRRSWLLLRVVVLLLLLLWSSSLSLHVLRWATGPAHVVGGGRHALVRRRAAAYAHVHVAATLAATLHIGRITALLLLLLLLRSTRLLLLLHVLAAHLLLLLLMSLLLLLLVLLLLHLLRRELNLPSFFIHHDGSLRVSSHSKLNDLVWHERLAHGRGWQSELLMCFDHHFLVRLVQRDGAGLLRRIVGQRQGERLAQVDSHGMLVMLHLLGGAVHEAEDRLGAEADSEAGWRSARTSSTTADGRTR